MRRSSSSEGGIMLRWILVVVAALGLAVLADCNLSDTLGAGGSGGGGSGGTGGSGGGGGTGGIGGTGGEVTCAEPNTDSYAGACVVGGGCIELYAPVDPSAFAAYCTDSGGTSAENCAAHMGAGVVCVQSYQQAGSNFTWVYFIDGTAEDVNTFCAAIDCAQVFNIQQ
jgi:hypothetical protein